jgi:hypothetical protein
MSRYHEFCFRRNIDEDRGDAIAAYLQDLAKHHEDWQVPQAREEVRLYRYFKGLLAITSTEKGEAEGLSTRVFSIFR